MVKLLHVSRAGPIDADDDDVFVRVRQLGYDRLAGAQANGSWRSVSAAVVARTCSTVIASAAAGPFDWSAARMGHQVSFSQGLTVALCYDLESHVLFVALCYNLEPHAVG